MLFLINSRDIFVSCLQNLHVIFYQFFNLNLKILNILGIDVPFFRAEHNIHFQLSFSLRRQV
jgi:hypothetical protein